MEITKSLLIRGSLILRQLCQGSLGTLLLVFVCKMLHHPAHLKLCLSFCKLIYKFAQHHPQSNDINIYSIRSNTGSKPLYLVAVLPCLAKWIKIIGIFYAYYKNNHVLMFENSCKLNGKTYLGELPHQSLEMLIEAMVCVGSNGYPINWCFLIHEDDVVESEVL